MTSMSSLGKLNVGVLGSCRVHNPLEMVQALRILRGDYEVPENLMQLSGQARKLDDDQSFARCFGKTDIVVCEIPSVRIAEFRGHQLQINLLRNFLLEAGLSQAGVRELYAASEGLGSTQPATDPLAIEILRDGTFYEMDPNQIDEALTKFMDLVDRPVLFVGIVEKLENGRSIKQRAAVHAAIADFVSNRSDTDFFNPSTMVEEYGFHTVVRDMGHYKENFVPTVGEELAKQIENFHARMA